MNRNPNDYFLKIWNLELKPKHEGHQFYETGHFALMDMVFIILSRAEESTPIDSDLKVRLHYAKHTAFSFIPYSCNHSSPSILNFKPILLLYRYNLLLCSIHSLLKVSCLVSCNCCYWRQQDYR